MFFKNVDFVNFVKKGDVLLVLAMWFGDFVGMSGDFWFLWKIIFILRFLLVSLVKSEEDLEGIIEAEVSQGRLSLARSYLASQILAVLLLLTPTLQVRSLMGWEGNPLPLLGVVLLFSLWLPCSLWLYLPWFLSRQTIDWLFGYFMAICLLAHLQLSIPFELLQTASATLTLTVRMPIASGVCEVNWRFLILNKYLLTCFDIFLKGLLDFFFFLPGLALANPRPASPQDSPWLPWAISWFQPSFARAWGRTNEHVSTLFPRSLRISTADRDLHYFKEFLERTRHLAEIGV